MIGSGLPCLLITNMPVTTAARTINMTKNVTPTMAPLDMPESGIIKRFSYNTCINKSLTIPPPIHIIYINHPISGMPYWCTDVILSLYYMFLTSMDMYFYLYII